MDVIMETRKLKESLRELQEAIKRENKKEIEYLLLKEECRRKGLADSASPFFIGGDYRDGTK